MKFKGKMMKKKMITNQIDDYEIVEEITEDDNYEYKEMTFGELLDKSSLSQKQASELVRKEFAVNIHFMLSNETYEKAFEVVEDIANNKCLADMNAIVFLQYKPKGKHPDAFHSVLDVGKYRKLINHCEKNGVRYGFDSCSAPLFFQSVKGRDDEELLESLAESCESGIFSIYINSRGFFFPCNFTEDEKGWENGLDVANCDDFLKYIWYNKRTVEWRENLLSTTKDGHRHCPTFDLC